jgi:hypothetical protein
MPTVQWLYLPGTSITDAGLTHLARLTALKELDLRDTPVSRAGFEQLRQALPNCFIIR